MFVRIKFCLNTRCSGKVIYNQLKTYLTSFLNAETFADNCVALCYNSHVDEQPGKSSFFNSFNVDENTFGILPTGQFIPLCVKTTPSFVGSNFENMASFNAGERDDSASHKRARPSFAKATHESGDDEDRCGPSTQELGDHQYNKGEKVEFDVREQWSRRHSKKKHNPLHIGENVQPGYVSSSEPFVVRAVVDGASTSPLRRQLPTGGSRPPAPASIGGEGIGRAVSRDRAEVSSED
jgi:hypothetical protein